MADRTRDETMPMPPGIAPEPPPIEPSSGIPMPRPGSAPSGLTTGIVPRPPEPETLDQMRRRAGG